MRESIEPELIEFLSDSDVAEKIFWYFRSNYKTQNEAAERYGVSAQLISAISKGNVNPNDKMLLDLGLKKIKGYMVLQEKLENDNEN